jgi:hypothetical protein
MGDEVAAPEDVRLDPLEVPGGSDHEGESEELFHTARTSAPRAALEPEPEPELHGLHSRPLNAPPCTVVGAAILRCAA